jgi:uncharacterized membrane protein
MLVHGLGILGGWAIASLVFRGLLGLAVVALIVLLIIWVAKSIRHAGKMGGWHHHDDPLEIAKVRYAKGEISQAEYKKLINDLKG